jgi:hypothetical protein
VARGQTIPVSVAAKATMAALTQGTQGVRPRGLTLSRAGV